MSNYLERNGSTEEFNVICSLHGTASIHSMFNIISFATAVKKWQPGLMASSSATRAAAKGWIQSLSPAGCSGVLDGLKVGKWAWLHRMMLYVIGVPSEAEASSHISCH